jgi:hypothetical protein
MAWLAHSAALVVMKLPSGGSGVQDIGVGEVDLDRNNETEGPVPICLTHGGTGTYLSHSRLIVVPRLLDMRQPGPRGRNEAR